MRIRRRLLPSGWYPKTREETIKWLESLKADLKVEAAEVWAGVAPHAGWEFSGKAALQVFLAIKNAPETLAVVGGHLHPGDGILAAREDGYETSFGVVEADQDLLAYLEERLDLQEDKGADNTVEVQLPFIAALFPRARVLWLRAAPSDEAIALGEALAAAASKLGKKTIVIGSTDLTHYGPNYGFCPKGTGKEAVNWVKQVNDRRFLELLLKQDLTGALDDARQHYSACSAGGAVAAASFARQLGATKAQLLCYYTSYDVMPHSSFVGYAGLIYTR